MFKWKAIAFKWLLGFMIDRFLGLFKRDKWISTCPRSEQISLEQARIHAANMAQSRQGLARAFPELHRALSFYYYQPSKCRHLLPYSEVRDDLLRELGITIPQRDKDNPMQVQLYLKRANEYLAAHSLKAYAFELWAQ
jgi:hypothetical protein